MAGAEARETQAGSGKGEGNVIFEIGSDKQHKEDPKVVNAQTGEQEEVKPGEEVWVSGTTWREFIAGEIKDAEKSGNYRRAARLRGKAYDPDFGTSFRHNMVKVKNDSFTLLVGALIPLGLVVWWEGMRLVWPRARKWPGLFKYKPPEQQSTSGRVVRLSAR